MSGEDMRVSWQALGSKGLTDRGSVDASSERGGDYQKAVTLAGQTVYVTTAGMKELAAHGYGDPAVSRIYPMSIQSDPGVVSTLFFGDASPENPATIGKKP